MNRTEMNNDKSLRKARILFICTANAARSQMAEGYLRARYGYRYEVFSPGTRQSPVSPRAIEAMAERGIDISGHVSKTLDTFSGIPFDLAVTLCDNAHAVCPIVPSAKKTIHHGFADPRLTPGNNGEILDGYRRCGTRLSAGSTQRSGPGSPY